MERIAVTPLTFSQRIQSVQAPIIPTVAEWTRRHPGTISLGQGVVYYGPPEAAVAKISQFSATPQNHLYGPAQGLPRLQELIYNKLLTENGINAKGYQLIVTAGANMAFLNTILAICDPGDEVILLLPYYFNQDMAIKMCSCHPVMVATDHRFQPDLNTIRRAISNKTRAIVTISPNNPSGAVYPEPVLREINTLCAEKQIYHISDEAYEYFTYDDAKHFSPAAFVGAQTHTIALYSLSKAYGFASWRIGYMLVPDALYSSILKVQDTNLICPPGISQHAAIGALEKGSAYCRQKLRHIAQIRIETIKLLRCADDICQLMETQGAFYLLLKINTKLNDLTLTQKLISDFKVAVIPGCAFGLTDACYIRVSYAMLDRQSLHQGIERLLTGLRALC